MEQYGNFSLGQISKLLIEIIGQDAALAIAESQGISLIKEDLERIYHEEGKSFAHFHKDAKSGVIEVIRQFFGMLKEKYDFPRIDHFLMMFTLMLYEVLKTKRPFEVPQNKLMRFHLYNFFDQINIMFSIAPLSSEAEGVILIHLKNFFQVNKHTEVFLMK
ncbi:hypothetical protein FACS189476_11350 [Spirochaetia bacterium]|nr:hypothetical protein FACS189476_11350 [Spirochaetia bacterium]